MSDSSPSNQRDGMREQTDDFIIEALTELYRACGSEYGD